MKYTRKQVQEAIFVLEVEANSSLEDQDADDATMNCNLAMKAYEAVECSYHEGWRARLVEAAAVLRDGWLPGDELVNLHTGEVFK